ncbi:type III pantothenate kinase [Glaciecola sp. XM2]|uniref:type III pantothenate kinase n=1 Tax=Glaciecola sp. XM2 TaxID=1914931 RepID=UPI001BDED43B|nr:type III pantothenate kinase [Glaciecola sp. XM2]
MSGQSKLLIDIGNTKLKYCWYQEGESLQDIKGKTISLDDINTLLLDKPIVHFCSVKADAYNEHIIHLLKAAEVPFYQAHTKALQFGISNSYKTVSNMGSDRWLAMLGADALSSKDVLVIDAGTAVTCDFVVSRQHIGGWIAPGLKMLRASVAANANRVFDFEDVISALIPGTGTAECVANGALAQLVGMAHQAYLTMQTKSDDFTVIISGGDAGAIVQSMSNNWLVHDNLVLAGLARISASVES